ncbi:hypothetical protein [Pseudomonas fulva]|uniref:hypothetical protein n=1 Tax=Pseudomonas fulva TaxID=47880 RepID=UPI00384C5485
MRLLLIVVIAAMCVISGLAGLTAGMNLNPNTTIKFVPNWGSLGDWVSGCGALLAVIVTLWLADRSRREDVESVDVKCSMALVGGIQTPLLVVEATSDGKRDAHVSGVFFTCSKAKSNYWLVKWHSLSARLPAHLGYGQRAMLIANEGAIGELANFIAEHADGDVSGLTVHVQTTLKEFTRPIHKDVVEFIQTELKRR